MRFTLVVALAGAACLAHRRGDAEPDARGGSAVTVAGRDSLALELRVDATARAGDPVRIRLRARNVTGRPLDLYLRGRAITFDVVITRAAGDVVWRRLEGEIVPAIVHLRSLAPGERLEVETAWDQRTNAGSAVEAGEYLVAGSLLTEGEPLRAPPRPLTILSADG